jgi:hypothetical protein
MDILFPYNLMIVVKIAEDAYTYRWSIYMEVS